MVTSSLETGVCSKATRPLVAIRSSCLRRVRLTIPSPLRLDVGSFYDEAAPFSWSQGQRTPTFLTRARRVWSVAPL